MAASNSGDSRPRYLIAHSMPPSRPGGPTGSASGQARILRGKGLLPGSGGSDRASSALDRGMDATPWGSEPSGEQG
jgi:hypothetical protein